jgi:hypothetical protein
MKYPTLCLLISISISTYGQVESVELFPEQINNSAFNISSPSMNGQENRMCFRKTFGTKDAIMISDKDTDGNWSEPYPAIQFEETDLLQGCSLSPDGNRIYFGMDNDVYRIDYVSEKKWSKPQLLKSPVSDSETMECQPSMSSDNQTLSFIRNISTGNPDSPWQLTPFISKSTGNNGWASPKKMRIEMKEDEALHVFYYAGENKICFFSSGSSQSDWGNYYGLPDGTGGLTAVTKIDFKGGYVMWVNGDYTTGLIVTATNPSKIATIKFSQSLTDQLLLSNKKN